MFWYSCLRKEIFGNALIPWGKSEGAVWNLFRLFGRLAGADQQKVFQNSSQRRVIVATNIAETSLTLPGIRYVVDTGLARVSRYSPGTHTRRLPIEPIAQSNANQRKGRCGRVAEGICYRLFSESDFEDRAAFLSPEIQRCNLAEVILKMKAFHLGDIETFPFIQPPKPAAIRSGYQLLKELELLMRAMNLQILVKSWLGFRWIQHWEE
jgi:ATP-dependent helicase HrpA